MRGAAPMNVGFTTARLSTILVTRPSIAAAKPICSCVICRTLPNECAMGSQRYSRSSTVRMPLAWMAAPSKTQPSWLRRTPLERPVVPEV